MGWIHKVREGEVAYNGINCDFFEGGFRIIVMLPYWLTRFRIFRTYFDYNTYSGRILLKAGFVLMRSGGKMTLQFFKRGYGWRAKKIASLLHKVQGIKYTNPDILFNPEMFFVVDIIGKIEDNPFIVTNETLTDEQWKEIDESVREKVTSEESITLDDIYVRGLNYKIHAIDEI